MRPPATYTSQPPPRRFASIASTTHWAPSTSASSSTSSGRATAAELTDDLVGAGVEHRLRVGDLAHAAADRERHEHLVGRAARQLDDRGALVRRRRDVEEDELVGALAVVERRQLDRVAGVADVDEARALDDPPASTSMQGITRL